MNEFKKGGSAARYFSFFQTFYYGSVKLSNPHTYEKREVSTLWKLGGGCEPISLTAWQLVAVVITDMRPDSS